MTTADRIIAIIPALGTTWRVIRRKLVAVSSDELETALRALLRAGRISRRGSVWLLPESVPELRVAPTVEREKRKPPTKVQRYVLGKRFCSRLEHYVEPDGFDPRGCTDGLRSWCRECGRQATQARMAASRERSRRTRQLAMAGAIARREAATVSL